MEFRLRFLKNDTISNRTVDSSSSRFILKGEYEF